MCVAPNEKSAPVGYTAVGSLAADGQPPLAQRAVDHGHRPAAAVVIVEAGVLPLRPADQPHLEVLVQMQPHVQALDRRVADVPLPQVGPGGEVADELRELGPGRLAAQVAMRQPRVELDVGGDRLIGQSGVAIERCHQVTSSTVTGTRWTELLA